MVCIGITTSYEEGQQRLRHAYVQAVERAGGLPLVVPMLASEQAMHAVATRLDGLVVTGGDAVTDGLVGSLPDDLAKTDPVRGQSDRWILDAVLTDRKPVLGICYGMQLLNARAGGTLYADVERQLPQANAHSQKRGAEAHSVVLAEDSHLRTLLKTDALTVNTRHVQAVARVAAGLRVAATALDGVVEALENADGTVLGVQFHPERMGPSMAPLFEHLVDCARRRKAELIMAPH